MKILFDAIKCNTYKWKSAVMQEGFTKFCCFLWK